MLGKGGISVLQTAIFFFCLKAATTGAQIHLCVGVFSDDEWSAISHYIVDGVKYII